MYTSLSFIGIDGINIYSDNNWKENKGFLYFKKQWKNSCERSLWPSDKSDDYSNSTAHNQLLIVYFDIADRFLEITPSVLLSNIKLSFLASNSG